MGDQEQSMLADFACSLSKQGQSLAELAEALDIAPDAVLSLIASKAKLPKRIVKGVFIAMSKGLDLRKFAVPIEALNVFAPEPSQTELTEAEVITIRRHKKEGMTPDQIADYLALPEHVVKRIPAYGDSATVRGSQAPKKKPKFTEDSKDTDHAKRTQSIQSTSQRVKETPMNLEDSRTQANELEIAAKSHFDKGDYRRAEEFYLKALRIREEVLDAKHPDLAGSYNNLGTDYCAKGDYVQAEELHLKALRIREEVLDAKHPDLAGSYNNLCTDYCAKGDYDRAEAFHLKALRIYEEVLDAKHPHLACSYNNLGTDYNAKGDYDRAEEFYLKALRIREEVLEAEHPDLKSTYRNLEDVYKKLGNPSRAAFFRAKNV